MSNLKAIVWNTVSLLGISDFIGMPIWKTREKLEIVHDWQLLILNMHLLLKKDVYYKNGLSTINEHNLTGPDECTSWLLLMHL